MNVIQGCTQHRARVNGLSACVSELAVLCEKLRCCIQVAEGIVRDIFLGWVKVITILCQTMRVHFTITVPMHAH